MAASRRPKRYRPLGWLIAAIAMLAAMLAAPTPAMADATGQGNLSVNQATYIQGSSAPLRVTYYTWYSNGNSNGDFSDDNTNWIGIYRAGDPVGGNYLTYAYAKNFNGTVELNISSLAAGNYVAYYFYHDGYTQLAGPASFSISSNALSLDKYSYSKGSTALTATFSETRWPDPNDWVAIYKAGDPVDSAHYKAWAYAPNGSGTATVNISSLAPGNYVAYLLWQNGFYVLSGPVSFTVVPTYDHVFMIMLENSPYNGIYSDVTTTPYNMPNLAYLKGQGTWFSNYHGVTHPSDENYLAVAGGDTYTFGAYYYPNINDPNNNIANELYYANKDWRAYAEGNGPAGCNTSNNQTSWDPNYSSVIPTPAGKDATPWYPDNEPFVNYTNVLNYPSYCQSHVFDTQHYSSGATHDLADDLTNSNVPAFSWVSGDDWDNGEHSGNGNSTSRHIQDTWLGNTVNQIRNSYTWNHSNSLLIITWDEDYAYTANNQIPALVLGSSGVTANKISNTQLDHYSTGATIEDALSIAPITNNDRGAMPLIDAFTP